MSESISPGTSGTPGTSQKPEPPTGAGALPSARCAAAARGSSRPSRPLIVTEDEPWLVDRIADAAEGIGEPALTIGVVGGRGGAGASTLACALAVTAARSGHRTMLIDGDPLGGGLDVLLGGERAGGLRWPDL